MAKGSEAVPTDEAVVVTEAVTEAVAEAVMEEVKDNSVTFRAARFSLRNPYTNTLYESDGEYEIVNLHEDTDSARFIRVQLAAGVLTLM
jgi:hypothetical protein